MSRSVMNVNTAPEMDYFSFGSATVRVCPRKGDELGSESNPIVISDSEPLGSPSNPIVIPCDECNFSTDRLPAQPSSDADTEIMCTQEFWDGVISDIDSDSPNEDLEAGFPASHPGFDEFSTGGPLSAGQLLARDRRGTMVSTLRESSSEISGAVPASQVLPYTCSSLGQNHTANQLSSRESHVENVGRADQMEDEIAQLGSPSNTIVSRTENDATSDCTTEEHAGWFDVDSFQPTELSADQLEEIDLTLVPCLDDPPHKKDDILGEEQSWVDVHEPEAVERQADMGLIEMIDSSYANPSASNPENTEVFEPISSEDIRYSGTGSPALRFEKLEDDRSLDTDSATNANDDIVSPEPEDGAQADLRSSTPKANVDVISPKSEDGDQQIASPIVREAGLVLKQNQKTSLKRNLGFSECESPEGIRRSARVAKRVKV
ncbi:uncharacterized protein N7469_009716 [Penicillium citrinum]|uniref:Uncharacterized protein n=1 Tax=Penicillium citrinum TaxID=5077 RepID=A0A9W9NIX8_PENCI|nr:uncharacterized protein N7469_009716 [Penicillium citrinum]KAJ5220829.1 hypothetical protein N7469_009716 [Penicillium citrinum]